MSCVVLYDAGAALLPGCPTTITFVCCLTDTFGLGATLALPVFFAFGFSLFAFGAADFLVGIVSFLYKVEMFMV